LHKSSCLTHQLREELRLRVVFGNYMDEKTNNNKPRSQFLTNFMKIGLLIIKYSVIYVVIVKFWLLVYEVVLIKVIIMLLAILTFCQ